VRPDPRHRLRGRRNRGEHRAPFELPLMTIRASAALAVAAFALALASACGQQGVRTTTGTGAGPGSSSSSGVGGSGGAAGSGGVGGTPLVVVDWNLHNFYNDQVDSPAAGTNEIVLTS